MARYRFTGEAPVTVPDLKRFEDSPVMPGEVIETDVAINNACFELVPDAAPEADVIQGPTTPSLSTASPELESTSTPVVEFQSESQDPPEVAPEEG